MIEPYSDLTRLAGDALQQVYAIDQRNRCGPVEAPLAARERLHALAPLGEQGIGEAAALAEFGDVFVPACTAIASPRYWGLVNSTPWPIAVWLDLLISALNNNSGATHQGPAADAAEREALRVLASLLGWTTGYEALLVSGGSIANLHAALLLRGWAFPTWRDEGPPPQATRARIYCNASSHFSVVRALTLAGFGAAQVRLVASDERGAIDIEALWQLLIADCAAGLRPLAVFATLGTTGTGAIDPLDEIAELCRELGLWLHVDACYGGASLLLPELRTRLRGIVHADSVAIDPHKWFYMPVACSAIFTRHSVLNRRVFAVAERSYIPDTDAHGLERGMHTSRRAQGLALYVTLRALGFDAVRRAVRQDIQHARLIESTLERLDYRILANGELSVACVRAPFAGWDAASVDRAQGELAQRIRGSGMAWFATTVHNGQTWMRMNFLNRYTTRDDIASVCSAIEEERRRLWREGLPASEPANPSCGENHEHPAH